MIKKKKVIKKSSPKTNMDTVRRVFSGIESDSKWWKPKAGDNIIRILPSNREDGNFAYHSILHHGFKIDGKNRAFPCLGAIGKKCPVCQIISYYDTETDPDIKAVIQSLTPRHAYLMNMIERGKENGVQIYSAPKTVMRELMQYMNDEEYGDITDPEEGREVKINRIGEQLATKYSTRVSPKTSEIDMSDYESSMFNLEKEAYYEIPSYKKYIRYLSLNFHETLDIEAALDLEVEGEENEEDTLSRKKKKGKVVPIKKARRVEEDEDDIDDEDESDLEDL